MPIYIGDYFKDTRHLSTEEHGAYLLILMELWIKGGKMPETSAQRIAGFPENWEKIKQNIYVFFTIKNGFLSQKRLSRELKKWTKYRNSKRKAGLKGGRPKKPTGLTKDHLEVKPSPSPSPNRINNKNIINPTPAKRERDIVWDSICDLFGFNPQTKSEKTRIGKIVRDLTLKLSPGVKINFSITEQMKKYRSAHPTWELTPEALLKHWDTVKSGKHVKSEGQRLAEIYNIQ